MGSRELLDLHDDLREDHWRATHPFNADLLTASLLMQRCFRDEDQVAEVLRQWCAKRQPCHFGKLAATRNQIYFCVVRERDLANGDEGVAEKIATAKRLWKQRGIADRAHPPHGFLLAFCSEKVRRAAPDENLQRFAEKLLSLTGWADAQRQLRGDNSITSDFLYLRNPHDDKYYGFQFNVDFFAAAGDKRWWHDHRIPGGIGFTANSTGHMRYFRDWYEQPGSDHGPWALKQAMLTIGGAHEVEIAGEKKPVTWLLDADERGRPTVPDTPCPLNPVPGQLKGKDWTKYAGYLHTDHAVRREFFADRETPPTGDKPYLMDFTYLFDKRLEDFVNFTGGKLVSEDDVYAEIGRPETWTHRDTKATEPYPPEEAAAIAELMTEVYAWEPLLSLVDSAGRG